MDATSARTSGRVSLTATEACIVPEDVQIALYRIAQEAVSNAVKHAQAAAIDISVRCREGAVVLRIEDDGSGFDAADVRPENMGLDIMRERADEIDARLRVKSVRDCGTTVEVAWPGDACYRRRRVDMADNTQRKGRLYV